MKAVPKLLADLRARRLQHPARLADAILHRLGAVGTPANAKSLLESAEQARTLPGRWKFYAAAQDIFARHPAAEVAKQVNAYWALLLRDLPPRKRGELAAALLKSWQEGERDLDALPPMEASLWLAWSLSSTDPEAALKLFRRGLDANDPALRLLAGLGITRISDGRIPYRLTAVRSTTAPERDAWLKGLKVRPADDWRFPDPLDRPLIRTQRGGRIDLWWLAADGSVRRKHEDVWPAVLQILPDGTFYSSRSEYGRDVALTGPDGEILIRFPIGRFELKYGLGLEPHGGFWALGDDPNHPTYAAEFTPTGERLWELPLPDGARFVAGAGPGRVVLVRSGRLEIVDRRGDVIWSPEAPPDDPRSAYAVDPDTVLVVCRSGIRLIHRTKGVLKQIEGFDSAAEVRYHPEKPWLVFDAGGAAVYDPREGKLAPKRQGLSWTNEDDCLYSKYLRGNQRHPEE